MNNTQSTDAELVAATLDGSREAFGTLVERHQQFVCALAYSKTGSRAASEDIAQETFFSAWKNLATLRVPGNFRGWLCGTVRNLAAKFTSRRGESEPLPEDVPAPIAAADEIMTREEETLLHVRVGGSPSAVAKGWIACGAVAVAPLFACGAVAIGGIACGGFSVGILSMAAIGVGVLSFSGMAFGGAALGGLAVGWIALGGAALGWLAAYGGLAKAGVYGLGDRVIAPHANDAVARAFFQENGIFHALRAISNHGILLQIAIFAPMMILSLWANRCLRKQKE